MLRIKIVRVLKTTVKPDNPRRFIWKTAVAAKTVCLCVGGQERSQPQFGGRRRRELFWGRQRTNLGAAPLTAAVAT